MKWLKRLFKTKVTIVTFQTKKEYQARQKVHAVCDRLNRESGRPAKNWK